MQCDCRTVKMIALPCNRYKLFFNFKRTNQYLIYSRVYFLDRNDVTETRIIQLFYYFISFIICKKILVEIEKYFYIYILIITIFIYLLII